LARQNKDSGQNISRNTNGKRYLRTGERVREEHGAGLVTVGRANHTPTPKQQKKQPPPEIDGGGGKGGRGIRLKEDSVRRCSVNFLRPEREGDKSGTAELGGMRMVSFKQTILVG